jgi:RND family efflux transporter MFP subunit
VLTSRVAYEQMSPSRGFVATVRPRVESDLGFRVGGKIAGRLVNVGDTVKLGQPLAVLDTVDLRLQREQAEAERGAARAALASAEAELARVRALRGGGWSTPAALDRQQAATEEASGRLVRAERALSLAGNALNYATLASDAPGVVTATLVEPGQVVTPGQPAIRVARLTEKEAVVAVPEASVGRLRTSTASVVLWSQPDRPYRATLRELSPAADPTTRTYQARYTIEGADDAVQFGMTATVTLTDPADQRIARLPLSALFNQGAGPAVWVVGPDGRPALREVSVLRYEGREVLVSTGVSEGDEVVTLGVQKLEPTRPVRVVRNLQF